MGNEPFENMVRIGMLGQEMAQTMTAETQTYQVLHHVMRVILVNMMDMDSLVLIVDTTQDTRPVVTMPCLNTRHPIVIADLFLALARRGQAMACHMARFVSTRPGLMRHPVRSAKLSRWWVDGLFAHTAQPFPTPCFAMFTHCYRRFFIAAFAQALSKEDRCTTELTHSFLGADIVADSNFGSSQSSTCFSQRSRFLIDRQYLPDFFRRTFRPRGHSASFLDVLTGLIVQRLSAKVNINITILARDVLAHLFGTTYCLEKT
jgi:hypothetical protein